MRILHVYKDYPPVRGGIENHVRTLAEGQAAQGHAVEVVVASPERTGSLSTESGVRVRRCMRLATLRSTPISPGLVTAAVRRRAEIIHLHYPHPPGEIGWLLRGCRPPAVVGYHADIVRQKLLARLLRPVTRRVLGCASRILVSNPAMATTSREVARHQERVRVVPYGIPLPPAVAPDDAELLALEGRHPRPRVLFVGRLRHYKGVQHLIDAMTRVEGSLLIAGDGPLRSKLESRVRARGLRERVRFLGEVGASTIWRLYEVADVFVLPSDSRAEAYGLVQVEAMAAGVPVISTELGTGTSWVNRHGETGLVVPPADASALASALDRLLHDEDLRARMSRAARQRVCEELLADRMVERVLEVYDEILRQEITDPRRR